MTRNESREMIRALDRLRTELVLDVDYFEDERLSAAYHMLKSATALIGEAGRSRPE